MKKINLIPVWLRKEKQTPLDRKLNGKHIQYDHVLFCSCLRSKPIGSYGCICIKALRRKES